MITKMISKCQLQLVSRFLFCGKKNFNSDNSKGEYILLMRCRIIPVRPDSFGLVELPLAPVADHRHWLLALSVLLFLGQSSNDSRQRWVHSRVDISKMHTRVQVLRWQPRTPGQWNDPMRSQWCTVDSVFLIHSNLTLFLPVHVYLADGLQLVLVYSRDNVLCLLSYSSLDTRLYH